jgi:ribosomal protein L40E
MSKTWKWVLGTVLVLVVIAGIACALIIMGGFMKERVVVGHGMFQSSGWGDFDQHSQMMGGAYGYAGPGQMMGGGYGFNGRCSMMRGHGFFPSFGGLIPLALLGLLVYGAYRLGKKKSNAQVSAVVATSEVVAESAASEPMDGQTCRKCGAMVQEDWRNCPHCGTKQ